MNDSESAHDLLNKKFSEHSPSEAEHVRNYFIERQDEIKEWANNSSNLFNKSCYLINSGAVIAVLAYFGASVNKGHPFALNIALIFFLAGLLLNTLFLYLEYLRHAKHHATIDKIVHRFYKNEISYLEAYNQDNENSIVPKHIEFASVGAFICWILGVLIMVCTFTL